MQRYCQENFTWMFILPDIKQTKKAIFLNKKRNTNKNPQVKIKTASENTSNENEKLTCQRMFLVETSRELRERQN